MLYNREIVQQVLSNQPFEPVEIVTSAGVRYRITHPEMYLLSEPLIVVMVDAAKGFVAMVPYGHISTIEHPARASA